MSGADIGPYPHGSSHSRSSRASAAAGIVLRTRYAMSGTAVAVLVLVLRARCAMSGTAVVLLLGLSYGCARRCPGLTYAARCGITLWSRNEVLAYARATRCPVLTRRVWRPSERKVAVDGRPRRGNRVCLEHHPLRQSRTLHLACIGNPLPAPPQVTS
eukprot:2008954-Rhodomonas_salina.2